MQQPFKYLKDEREAIEATERQRKAAEDQARLRAAQIQQSKLEMASRYDEMVIKVLDYLREAAYPGQTVKKHCERDTQVNKWSGEAAWSIGYISHTSHAVGQDLYESESWSSVVLVRLIFDENNVPVRFDCSKNNASSISCGLSEVELIQTLKSLHPSTSTQ
jgi:hypothetical protein